MRSFVLRCPEWDPAESFDPVVVAVESLAAGVEIIRPGLLALAASGVASYYGGEEVAAERLVDVVAEQCEVDVVVGVADGLFVAYLAAHEGRIVPAGATAEFLSGIDVSRLGRPELVGILRKLGVNTFGEFTALPRAAVADRFGADAVFAHRLAAGEDTRPPVARTPPPDLTVSIECDPPLERVDVAAFTARALAVQLHRLLDVHGLACDRLIIDATTGGGVLVSRTWRHDGALSAAAVTDRVRWQLDGWLTNGGVADGGIVALRLTPDGLMSRHDAHPGLWGAVGSAEARAARALVHVQGLLGHDAVVTAVEDGGRGLAERRRLVPWGEPPVPVGSPERPWPGAPPDPEPALITDRPSPVRVVDSRGGPVTVSGRYVLSAAPAKVTDERGRASEVVAWAGPWPVEEHWWEAPRRFARLQVRLDDSRALLLILDGGQWFVEGSYD